MWLENVSGKALAAGFALVPAASALPLTFKKRYLAPKRLEQTIPKLTFQISARPVIIAAGLSFGSRSKLKDGTRKCESSFQSENQVVTCMAPT